MHSSHDTFTTSSSNAQAVLSPFLAVQSADEDNLFAPQQQQQHPHQQQQQQHHLPDQQLLFPPQQLPSIRIHSMPPLRPSTAAAPRAVVELSTRKQYSSYVDPNSGEVCWDALETSSDDSEDLYTTPAGATVVGDPEEDSAGSSAWLPADAAGATSSSAFEPFSVEEQATEVKYLRDVYTKKVRGGRGGGGWVRGCGPVNDAALFSVGCTPTKRMNQVCACGQLHPSPGSQTVPCLCVRLPSHLMFCISHTPQARECEHLPPPLVDPPPACLPALPPVDLPHTIQPHTHPRRVSVSTCAP